MRISKWHLDKNIKPNEMQAIVRKRQQRKLAEPDKGELRFWVRDQEVKAGKINRWMMRNRIPERNIYIPSPAACKKQ